MAGSFVKSHTPTNSKSAGTTINLTLASAVPAGNTIIVGVAMDNTTATAPVVSSIATQAGETATWTRLFGIDAPSATAGGSVRGEVWAIRTTVQWSAASYVVTLSASVGSKAVMPSEFSGVTVTQRSTAGTGANVTGTSAVATTTGTAPAVGDLVIGFGTNEVDTVPGADTDTLGGAWLDTLATGSGTTGGTANTNVFCRLQYKFTTAAGAQSYQMSTATNDGVVGVTALIPLVSVSQDVALQWNVGPNIVREWLSNEATGGANVSVTTASDTPAGNTIIAWHSNNFNTASLLTGPTTGSWTLLGTGDSGNVGATNGSHTKAWIGTASGGAQTITVAPTPLSEENGLIVAVLDGVYVLDDVAAGNGSQTAATSLTALGTNPTGSQSTFFTAASTDGNGAVVTSLTVAAPQGRKAFVRDTSFNFGMAVGQDVLPGSGATGARTWTGAPAGRWSTLSFALKPAGGGTTPVSQDFDLRWRVLNVVQSDQDLRWRVLNRVQQDADLRWRVLGAVLQDFDLRWRVLNRVQQDSDLRWRVLNVVLQDFDLRWNVLSVGLTPVSQDFDLRWRVLNRVQQDFDLRWRVLGAVQSDVDLRWRVLAAVSADTDLRWRTLNTVQLDSSLLWRVLNGTSQTFDLRWRVLGAVFQDFDLRWVVVSSKVPVLQDFDLRWRVLNRVLTDADLRWRVLNAVNRDIELDWRVLNRVNSDTALLWRALNSVSKDFDLRWSVKQLVFSDTQLLWLVQASPIPLPADLTASLSDIISATGSDHFSAGILLDRID